MRFAPVGYPDAPQGYSWGVEREGQLASVMRIIEAADAGFVVLVESCNGSEIGRRGP